MNNRLDETLARVAEAVFESLAFVLPAFEEEGHCEESAPPEAADTTAASISFAGPFEGTLALSASNELLPAIAANMLGLDLDEWRPAAHYGGGDPEVPWQDVQRDAFKELLNVTCGNLLPALAGEQAVFDVGAAELLVDGALPATVAGRPPLAAARLHLEGGWVELALFAPQRLAAGVEATS